MTTKPDTAGLTNLVAAVRDWADHMDQWERFKIETEAGPVYLSIDRSVPDPDAFEPLAVSAERDYHHVLSVFGLDDKLVVDIELTDDQAAAIHKACGVAISTADCRGYCPVPYVYLGTFRNK